MENKKDYSDWLVVSDIDGTLNNKLRRTPKINTKAIDSFVHELKGNFTLASARSVPSMRPHYLNLPNVKTPAIILNGAGIYDYQKEEMVWFNPIKESSVELIREAMKKFRFLEIGVFASNMIYLVRPRIMSEVMMLIDRLPFKRLRTIDEVPKGNWGKIICFCPLGQTKIVKKFFAQRLGEDHYLIDTGPISFDLVDRNTNKGYAVHVLSDMMGIERDKISAIGDYYNDWDMLKSVSHPACAGQAPDDIKEICEFKACHCNKGAVADLIEYIKKTY